MKKIYKVQISYNVCGEYVDQEYFYEDINSAYKELYSWIEAIRKKFGVPSETNDEWGVGIDKDGAFIYNKKYEGLGLNEFTGSATEADLLSEGESRVEVE